MFRSSLAVFASVLALALMLAPIGTAEAGFKCGLVEGKLVCGKTEGGGIILNPGHQKNKDRDDDDDDHRGKKDTGLSECTIQNPNSGGGCKTGFKRACEKMKSGKKCCGCVPDPNPKPAEAPKDDTPPPPPPPADNTPAPPPAVQRACCTGTFADGSTTQACADSASAAAASVSGVRVAGQPPKSISCNPAP